MDLRYSLKFNAVYMMFLTDFISCIYFALQQGGGDFLPVLVGRKTLKNLNRTEVFIKKWPKPLQYQYYRNIIPDVSIKMCSSCFRVR